MIVNVIPTPNFRREAKKLIKKFRSLKSELSQLEKQLKENPKMGIPIGADVYKIRLGVKSKGKGKRGGMRVITMLEVELVEVDDTTDIYLLSIYDKSEYENFSDSKLKELINDIKEALDRNDQE